MKKNILMIILGVSLFFTSCTSTPVVDIETSIKEIRKMFPNGQIYNQVNYDKTYFVVDSTGVYLISLNFYTDDIRSVEKLKKTDENE